MDKNELIERYIYAVTKYMKQGMRHDVANELSSIIQDMLDDRCQGMTPTEHDVRVILEELGTPLELSQKYDADSKECLIGPPYYATYKYVMKLVAICVTGGMLLAQGISSVTNQKIWYIGLFDTFIGICGGLASAFFYVTILFAIFYKKGIKVGTLNDSIDNLPPVPKNTKKISKVDAIVGIVFSVIFTIVFLVCPQVISLVWINVDGIAAEPLFNIAYIRETWYFIIIFALLGIARDSMKLIEGTYTTRLMIVTVVTNVIDVILTSVWILNKNFINPEFFNALEHVSTDKVIFMNQHFRDFPKLFLAVIVIALTINTFEIIIKSLKK